MCFKIRFKALTIDFEGLILVGFGDFNSSVVEDSNDIKWTYPFGSKFTGEEFQTGIKEQHLLTRCERFVEMSIMEGF
jgi:hypothetical protein